VEAFFFKFPGVWNLKVISDNVQLVVSGIYRKLHTEMDTKSYNPFSLYVWI